MLSETAIPGAFLVDLEPLSDPRGFFARSFCRKEFAAAGLKTDVAQCNISVNRARGTLRGMHFQVPPMAEAKLVRCARGRIHDVILDLRPESSAYRRWVSAELSADNRSALYVPEGVAHGFQTLTDDAEVHYVMFEFYSPQHARGVRWDDPAFAIEWPLPDPIVSGKDRSYPLFGSRPLP